MRAAYKTYINAIGLLVAFDKTKKQQQYPKSTMPQQTKRIFRMFHAHVSDYGASFAVLCSVREFYLIYILFP